MSKEDVPEGIWPVVVLNGKYGDNDRGVGCVQINVRFDDGPAKGRMMTYEDEVNNKSAPYIMRSCKAVGWKARNLETLADDINAWIATTGGKSTGEVKHFLVKQGKKHTEWLSALANWEESGRNGPQPKQPIWAKLNGIGRGAQSLAAPSAASLSDANDAMRRAMEESGGVVDDDAPHAAGDEIPFVTASVNSEPTAIARVLRGAL